MKASTAIDDASESIRAANHLIGTDESIHDLYSILGDLRAIANRKYDFLSKLNDVLHQLPERSLRVDQDDLGTPDQLVGEIIDSLNTAQAHLLQVSRSLSEAHGHASHIGEYPQ